ncbi:hypothetical protein [Gloeothece verrucosa]|uniref:Uncharacterized protein n=1 Tax=Gloeothece verrucosa (strain PCC 7822) TaxID=497965 RepID=E0U697_GLOV7|nr:hypothetical protein [Gloeothece verrucosa]ADN12433.1 hypothetical protein Cyan7822_0388 [Gloeothece verrucosa PCC 7822]
MNKLPDTKTLLELLKIAKEAEQKTRELFEKGETFAQKWESRLEVKRKIVE